MFPGKRGGKLKCALCHLETADMHDIVIFASSTLIRCWFDFSTRLHFLSPEAFVPGVMKFYNDRSLGGGVFLFTVLN